MQNSSVCSESSDNNPDGLFNFSRLPWVVFLNILEFFKKEELCKLCLVNKLWRKACCDPSLWRCLDLTRSKSISDKDLDRLTSFSNNVVQLRISGCEHLTDCGVSCVMKQCHSLVELTMTHCELSDQVLEAVGENCSFLRKLDISLSSNFSDDGISKVCQGCSELEEVIIDQCLKLTSNALISLGNHCSGLRSLSTERVRNVADNGLIALVEGCTRLQSLRLPFCGLTNHCIYYIVRCCRDIHLLDLRGITLVDNDVCGLVTSCPKLEYLNLSLCNNLTDRSALEISKNCKSLKYLFLVHNKVTDQGLFLIGVHCKSLQHLDVSWCSEITEVGAKYVLNSCPSLKHLGLVRCDKVSESAVSELSSCFPKVFISTVRTEMDKFFIQGKMSNGSVSTMLQ